MSLNYAEVSERMLKAGGIPNTAALARVLGITPQAFSNYKKRGEIPTSLLFKFASIYDVSVDWLVSGEGMVYRAEESASIYCKGDDVSIDLSALSPDEIIYVGKLLKVLRRPEKSAVSAMKLNIDVFLSAVYPPVA